MSVWVSVCPSACLSRSNLTIRLLFEVKVKLVKSHILPNFWFYIFVFNWSMLKIMVTERQCQMEIIHSVFLLNTYIVNVLLSCEIMQMVHIQLNFILIYCISISMCIAKKKSWYFGKMTKIRLLFWHILIPKKSCWYEGETEGVEVEPLALLDWLTLPLNSRIDCCPSWIFDLIRVGQLQMSK